MKKLKVVDFIKTETASKRKMHPAGYLLLPNCTIARSGILQYGDVIDEDGGLINDGDVICVYRPGDALRKCVKYFNNIPLSKTHPKENEVTPETVKKVIVGIVGSNAHIEERSDGEVNVVADIMVHDKDTIEAIMNDEMTELSAGYETAYQKKRGTTKGGETFEAIQHYLMPNHVALVERGRCGSECKVCDNDIQNQKEKTMKLKRSKKAKVKDSFRYFLASDSEDGKVIEISEQVFKQLAKDEDAEVEEMDENEVEFEEGEKPEEENAEEKPEGDEGEEGGEEKPEEENAEEKPEGDEGEEGGEEESMANEDEEQEKALSESDEESEIFEVELDDGTIGKMDKVAYEYMKRFVDMQKKGDSMNPAEMLKLSAIGGRALGETFAIDSYIDGKGVFNARKLKQDVIKKHMPGVVVTSLKNDEALDSMFDCAIKTSAKDKADWQMDMINLSKTTVADGKQEVGMVEKARQERLKKINRKGE